MSHLLFACTNLQKHHISVKNTFSTVWSSQFVIDYLNVWHPVLISNTNDTNTVVVLNAWVAACHTEAVKLCGKAI